MAKDKKTRKEYNLNQSTESAGQSAALAEAAATASTLDANFLSAISADSETEAELDITKFERKNLPPLLPPKSIPVGTVIIAVIVKAVASPVSTVKGNLLWLRNPKTGTEFMLPCTGTVRAALLPGSQEEEKADAKANLERLNKEYTGKMIYLKKGPDRMGKRDKAMFIFDVRVGDAPKGTGK